MANKDPYAILGVERTAGADEIKRAYRKLAKKHHPDQNKGDAKAEERFKEVQAAYAILSDPKRREQFDRFGTVGPFAEGAAAGPGGARVYRWSSGGAPADFEFGDLSDILRGFGRGGGGGAPEGGASIFEELLGGGRRRRRRGRGASVEAPPMDADVEHEVTLDFPQAIHGTTLQLTLETPAAPTGRERIDVRIPPGVSDGQRIRIRGKGRPIENGRRGDLYIVARIRPHPYFRREGNDIHLDLPLSIAEATLGAKVNIPTLEGTTVLTVPPGIASGRKLRLAGRGVKDPRTGVQGDQYAVIKIVPPAKLTDQQRKLMEELAKTDPSNPREGLW